MNRTIRAVLSCAVLFAAALALSAENPRAERFLLDNGLEIIVRPDASSPLAYAELVFGSGSESLAAAEAGSLDLIRRVVAAEAAEIEAASGRPSPSWEGYANEEATGFRAALPPADLEGALTALYSAVAATRFDEASLEAHRADALADLIEARSDPDAIYEAALTGRLFSKYPWRRFPAGCEKTLSAATSGSLALVAAHHLAPGNAALVVAGPVDPEAIRDAAEAIFGEWKATFANKRPAPAPAHPRPGVARPTWLAYPDPSMPEGSFAVELRYRGPDAIRESSACLASHLWMYLAGMEEGRFMKAVRGEISKASGSYRVSVAAYARREGGTLSIAAVYEKAERASIPVLARDFKERVRGFELTDMRSDASYCSAAEYDEAKALISRLWSSALRNPKDAAEALALYWAEGSVDTLLSYPEKISGLGPKQVTAFVDAYFLKNLEIIALRVNPADYAAERAAFASSGFELISAAKAFWSL